MGILIWWMVWVILIGSLEVLRKMYPHEPLWEVSEPMLCILCIALSLFVPLYTQAVLYRTVHLETVTYNVGGSILTPVSAVVKAKRCDQDVGKEVELTLSQYYRMLEAPEENIQIYRYIKRSAVWTPMDSSWEIVVKE